MSPNTPARLIEQVPHHTDSRPFSLHHTDVCPETECALYLHCHEEMEFFYMERGSVLFQVEGAEYLLRAGDAVFIPPNLLHSARRLNAPSEKCSFYAVVFSPEMVLDIVPSYCEQYLSPVLYNAADCVIPLTPDDEWKCQILSHLRLIFSHLQTEVESCELLLRGSLLIIWQLLYNRVLSRIHENHASRHIYPQLKESVDYISAHYMDDLSLAELARGAGLSEGHFCRLFKAFTGFSPFQYINRKRVAKSCKYLARTDKKVAEVAALCGYNNISYFNRVFLQIMRETPSSYRRRVRG